MIDLAKKNLERLEERLQGQRKYWNADRDSHKNFDNNDNTPVTELNAETRHIGFALEEDSAESNPGTRVPRYG